MSRPRRRWAILVVGLLGQAVTCVFLYGLPMLVPQLRADRGLSLTAAGVIVGAPSLGLLCTLIAWGAAADRFGERDVMALGLILAAGFLVVASRLSGTASLAVVLALAGGAAGSVNAASGRLVMGWFGKDERGLAMGIRQTAQPLGVAIAALTLPGLARHAGIAAALLFPACLCALLAVAIRVVAVDPPRPAPVAGERTGSPYRGTALWRVHASSAALVVPQFAVSAFTLVYLVDERGWSAIEAGRIVFLAQLAGAAGRVLTGVWSDRVGSRMRPMRQLAVASAITMLAIAIGAATHTGLVVAAFLVGAVVTVADNGLAFTGVAEMAGSAWAGKALGIHNTGQNIVAGITPALVGAAVTGLGYGWGFVTVALWPLLAVAIIPVPPRKPATLAGPCAESLGTSETRTPST